MSTSALSHRAPAEYTPLSEQDLSQPNNCNHEFTTPVELGLPAVALPMQYEPLSSLPRCRTGLDPTPTSGQLDENQQQHLDHPQRDLRWKGDCGGYEVAVAPQISTKQPVEFRTGYSGEEYAPRWTEQWAGIWIAMGSCLGSYVCSQIESDVLRWSYY